MQRQIQVFPRLQGGYTVEIGPEVVGTIDVVERHQWLKPPTWQRDSDVVFIPSSRPASATINFAHAVAIEVAAHLENQKAAPAQEVF